MNKIAKNFLSTSFSNLLSQLVSFLIVVYYARILGKSDFGAVTLAQQILLYFTMTVLFGLQVYGTRIAATSKERISATVSEIISFRLLTAVFCYGILVFFCFFIKHNPQLRLLLLFFGISLLPMSFNLDWVFNGLQEMSHNAIFNLLKNLLPCALIYLFFKSQQQIYFIPLFMNLGLCAGIFYYFYIYIYKKGYSLTFTMNSAIFFRYIKVGYPFFISGLLGMVNNNIDKIIMGFTRSESELGVYQSAYTFISFLINIIALIFTPVFPAFISLYKEKRREELQLLLNTTAKFISIVATPILFGGMLFAKDIILLFYKKQYIDAWIPFVILLFYIFILFFREIYAYQLNAWNLEKQYLKILGVSSFCNLFFNLLLIPRFGMVAAAWVTTLTEIINLLLMRKYAVKVMRTEYLKNLLKSFLPSIAMALGIIILKYFHTPFLLNFFCAILLYFCFIFILRIFTVKEIKSLLHK